ncbi:hypothetical protein HYS28_03405 [Candidatus Uhrbacteria bacterium]|nr:hypothetical protein [Candidatus Uhrbacteria bacterium]
MLDNAKTYRAYDPDDIAFGIDHLGEQVRVAWCETRAMRFPSSYAACREVVVVGMGGSALGPDMLVHAWAKKLTVPMTIVHDYALPSTVGPKTLVILSSFSGTTEEVLAAGIDAKRRKAKVVVIAAGGELAAMAEREHWPRYVFTPGDLAKEPRLGTGFSLAGILGMLARMGFAKVTEADVRRLLTAMGDVLDMCAVDVPKDENPAKIVAQGLLGRVVFLVAAEHLMGNAHVFTNQVNETSKQYATFYALPELNHHLMEGLTYPKGFAKGVTVLFLRSAHYHPRVQKRCDVTADIFERVGAQVIDYVAGGKDAIEECGEVLQFGSFVSYYLAMLNKVNPRPIPFVDEFKKRMAE